jgi:hypothetical protein
MVTMRATCVFVVLAVSQTVVAAAILQPRAAFQHPGLLHTDDDFARIKSYVDSKKSPWITGWNKLAAHASTTYSPRAVETLCRGTSSDCTENYANLYRDVSAAYVNAIYWRITGNTVYADAAGKILDAWSSTLKQIWGSSDKFLAAGLYAYQLANAGEILRTYDGWDGLTDLVNMLVSVFYPMNHSFLTAHNGAKIDHYWANVSNLYRETSNDLSLTGRTSGIFVTSPLCTLLGSSLTTRPWLMKQ